jgi:hypothetical protein
MLRAASRNSFTKRSRFPRVLAGEGAPRRGVRYGETVTSTSMQRLLLSALALSVVAAVPAFADPQMFPVQLR